MKNLLKTFLFVSCLLLPIIIVDSGSCGTEYPEKIADRLQARYDKIASLSFNFIQNTSGEMTGRPRRGSGKAAFVKLGGKSYMRWDYTSPDKQVLTNDGETFSMYFAKLQQMIVSPADTLDADLTYSFFTGKGVLKKDFHIRPADEEFQSENSAAFKVIKLIPQNCPVPGSGHPSVGDARLTDPPNKYPRPVRHRNSFEFY